MSKELLAATAKELLEWPDTSMEEEAQGKHRKVTLRYKEHSRLVIVANTPSDQRALPNHIALVRRELRGMGASKRHPQPPQPRPFKPHVPATQTPFKDLEIAMKPSNTIEAIFAQIGSLRYGEMLILAELLRDAAVETGLRRNYPGDWAKMLHSVAETKAAQ